LLPHEIAAKKIIPPIKGILIHELKKRGLSQRKIALLFDISQPQVHKYLRKNIDYYMELLRSMGFVYDTIDRYIGLLVDLAMGGDKERFIKVMAAIIDDLTYEYICRVKGIPPSECTVHRLFTDPYIEEFRYYVSRIISKPGFSKLIPEVGTNIVYAPRKPKTVSEVIGIPGRIIRVGVKAIAVGEPTYGGSQHLARTLLIIMNHNPDKTCGINLKYNEKLKDIAEKLGLHVLECGPHRRNSFWEDFEKCSMHSPDMIMDKGGEGLEPVVYLYCKDLNELEHIVDEILHGLLK